MVVPSPIWPLLFPPQHFDFPLDSKAQVFESPLDIAIAVETPKTSTGVLWYLVGVELSTGLLSPTEDAGPQHLMVPSAIKAQFPRALDEMEVAFAIPARGIGLRLPIRLPTSPS